LGIVLVAAAVTAGGAAFAATDPLGWGNASPTSADYGSNPGVHVHAPTARQIACSPSGAVLRCSPATVELPSGVELVNGHRSSAELYSLTDKIRPPFRGFTRHSLLAYIADRRAARDISLAQAARFRADVAAVPDSFFTEFALESRYGTYSLGGETRNGLTLAPPPGTPPVVVCEPRFRGLTCQNLNGDDRAPVGAGVYIAVTARTWRYQRLPPDKTPPGFPFTRAEYRVISDMVQFATVTYESRAPVARPTPPPPPPSRPLRHRDR
jgi:hypothetical protein